MRLTRLVALVGVIVLVSAANASANLELHSVSSAITAAPAWTADQLLANPSTDWISTGGNIFNQRYSALNQINTTNVASLKQAWVTHLDKSGAAVKYSQEDSPVVYNGVMYLVTGNDD